MSSVMTGSGLFKKVTATEFTCIGITIYTCVRDVSKSCSVFWNITFCNTWIPGLVPRPRLRCLGGVRRMAAFPQLYFLGSWETEFIPLGDWNFVSRDLKQAAFHLNTWQNGADACPLRRAPVTNGMKRAEQTRNDNVTAKRKARAVLEQPPSSYIYNNYSRHSRRRHPRPLESHISTFHPHLLMVYIISQEERMPASLMLLTLLLHPGWSC